MDEDLQFSEGEEKAAPMPLASSNGSYPTLATAVTAPKVGHNFYGSSYPHVGQQSSLLGLYWV